MNNENIISMTPGDKPLFILRYSPLRIAWRLFWPYLPILPLLSYIVFWASYDCFVKTIFCKLGSFVLIAGGLYLIYDMIAMKGIYLYEDRVVKRYRMKNEIVVALEFANYTAMSNLFLGGMWLFYENTPLMFRSFKGVWFDEKLASRRDVIKFRELLSKISGRKIEELEHASFATKLKNMGKG